MSKLMIILGIIVAAAGAVIGALIYVSPGQMQVLGLTPEAAAVLLVGGLALIGLGGVIGALDKTTAATRGLRELMAGQDNGQNAPRTSPGVVSEFSTSTITPPPFPMPPPPVEPPPSPASRLDSLLKDSKAETNRAVAESQETVAAIDKAKSELEEAFRTPPEPPPPPPPLAPPPPEVTAAEPAADPAEGAEMAEETEDTQLFVVEERLIRGRPARVLSDGTVEAETDDGWMRFENLEHLEEYLDAMSPGQA
ncbi:MAG: hypothetical protein AB7S92_06805 [Parvibaculaceae bacterium]